MREHNWCGLDSTRAAGLANPLQNPDADKIRAAAEALAAEKPTLARVGGEVLQGHRGDESDAGSVSLADMLKAGA